MWREKGDSVNGASAAYTVEANLTVSEDCEQCNALHMAG